jgi:hypothetical protein
LPGGVAQAVPSEPVPRDGKHLRWSDRAKEQLGEQHKAGE